MAVVFPIPEDVETLRAYAAVTLNFSPEDIEQLESTCTTLIADAKTISAFVFPSSFIDGSTGARQRLPDDLLPICYARTGVPVPAMGETDIRHSDNPVHRTRERLRQHGSTLSGLLQRLHRGRIALKGLNEKYDYGFSVVSFSKAGASQQLDLLGEGKSPNVTATNGDSNNENNQRCEINDVGNSTRNARDSRHILEVYTRFIYTFDALHKWAVNAVGILDGEGRVPEPGRYAVPAEPRHADFYSSANTYVPSNTSPNTMMSSNDISTGSSIANGGAEAPAHMRTVRVTRYEVHDVSSVYHSFEAQASLFYASSYTIYDPRVRKRLLDPAYYQAMRDTLRELGCEIDRLQDLQVNLQERHETPVTIAFRPTLCEFQYMRDTLRLYWSICLVEDDLTSLQYHCLLYSQCVADAGEVMDTLHQQHLSQAHTSNPITVANMASLSPEERGAVEAGFESFWQVRGKVFELRSSLARNITEGNRTHRYRVAAVPPPRLPPTPHMSQGLARRALNAMRAWVKSVSCEVDLTDGASLPLPRDDEGVVLSITSPQAEAKAVLQRHVTRLVSAVEAQAAVLERKYPGTFYRDARAKWAERAGGVIRYLESVSVVFARPT